jgi:hypothetical protein
MQAYTVSGGANTCILISVIQVTVNDKVFSLAASTPGKEPICTGQEAG